MVSSSRDTGSGMRNGTRWMSLFSSSLSMTALFSNSRMFSTDTNLNP